MWRASSSSSSKTSQTGPAISEEESLETVDCSKIRREKVDRTVEKLNKSTESRNYPEASAFDEDICFVLCADCSPGQSASTSVLFVGNYPTETFPAGTQYGVKMSAISSASTDVVASLQFPVDSGESSQTRGLRVLPVL